MCDMLFKCLELLFLKLPEFWSWTVMRPICPTLLLFFVTFSSASFGQGVSVGRDGIKLSGFGDVDEQKTLDYWVESEKHSSLAHLNLQIDLIEQICVLDESETEKLQLAARRVVAQRVASGKNQLNRFMLSSGLVKGDLSKMPEKGLENPLYITGAGSLDEGVVYFRSEFEVEAVEEKFWQKMLASMLGEEQMRRFESYQIQRNKELLRIAVDQEIAQLDQQVCLFPEQRATIRKSVLAALESKVTWSNPNTPPEAAELADSEFDTLGEKALRPQQLERLELLRNTPRANVGWRDPNRR